MKLIGFALFALTIGCSSSRPSVPPVSGASKTRARVDPWKGAESPLIMEAQLEEARQEVDDVRKNAERTQNVLDALMKAVTTVPQQDAGNTDDDTATQGGDR